MTQATNHAAALAHYAAMAAEALRAASYCEHTAPADSIETLVYLRGVEMPARFTQDEFGQVCLWSISLNGSWVMPELWLTDAEIAVAIDQYRSDCM